MLRLFGRKDGWLRAADGTLDYAELPQGAAAPLASLHSMGLLQFIGDASSTPSEVLPGNAGGSEGSAADGPECCTEEGSEACMTQARGTRTRRLSCPLQPLDVSAVDHNQNCSCSSVPVGVACAGGAWEGRPGGSRENNQEDAETSGADHHPDCCCRGARHASHLLDCA